MADFQPTPVFYGSDNLERSVSIVVDPRDAVTGDRVPVPLEVRLKDVAAEPIAARSGVYCFTDLKLAAGNYTVQVRPLKNDRSRYFDAEQQFPFDPIPLPAEPLKRNPVQVKLLPRTSYPFEALTTLARGRIVRASDGSPIENAQIFLTLDSVDKGLWQRTDERGEFIIFFPRTPPEDDPAAGLKDFKFQLRFDIPGHSHTTIEHMAKEGTVKSMDEIEFPGA
ncbi:MAG: hypothetical protein ACREBG_30925 [Pyrinomonadaceae bacterium]